jgi:hypothetical protein
MIIFAVVFIALLLSTQLFLVGVLDRGPERNFLL